MALGKVSRRLWHAGIYGAAVLFGLQVIFAIAGPPRRLVNWLVGKHLRPRATPHYVIVLGGGGIPSESSLLRVYAAAEFGRGLTGTTFVVSLPADSNPETNSVGRMRNELVMRGIPAAAIRMETHGRNTHEEAVNVAQLLGPAALREPIVIVTSDYHMRRSVLLFRKVGFTDVAAVPAVNVEAEADPGPFAWLRYTMWGNWEREIRIFRELIAILTSKLRGWI